MIINKINKHLDKIEDMEDNLKNDISRIFNKIDIKELLSKPDSALKILTQAIIKMFQNIYVKKIILESRSFVNNVSNESKKTS